MVSGPFDEAGMFDVDTLGEPEFEGLAGEQRLRPDVFVKRFGRGRSRRVGKAYWCDDPFKGRDFNDVICWNDFKRAFNAIRFANVNGIFLDSLLTLHLEKLALSEHGSRDPSALRESLKTFRRKMNQWLSDNGLPNAHVGVIENGAEHGLHAHLLLFLGTFQQTSIEDYDTWKPTKWYRKRFRQWLVSYAGANQPKSDGRIFDLRPSNQIDIQGQWYRFHYLMKGVDPKEIVVQSQYRHDERDLRLADLVAYKLSPLGPIPNELDVVWVSRSLVSHYQRGGKIPKVRYRGREMFDGVPEPFQSELDAGIFDVRRLYPINFVRSVMGKGYVPLANGSDFLD